MALLSNRPGHISGSMLPRMVFLLALAVAIGLYAHRALDSNDFDLREWKDSVEFAHATPEETPPVQSDEPAIEIVPSIEEAAAPPPEIEPEETIETAPKIEPSIAAVPEVDEPVEAPEPLPAAPPKPEPTPEPLRYSQVYEDQTLWPQQVRLVKAINVPIHIQGKRVGEARLVEGTTLPVVRLRPDGKIVALNVREEIVVEEDHTNLLTLANTTALTRWNAAQTKENTSPQPGDDSPPRVAASPKDTPPETKKEEASPPHASWKEDKAKDSTHQQEKKEGEFKIYIPDDSEKKNAKSKKTEEAPPEPKGTPEIDKLAYRQLKASVRVRRSRQSDEFSWDKNSEQIKVRVVFNNEHSNIAFENHRVELYVIGQSMSDNKVARLLGKERFSLNLASRARQEMESGTFYTAFVEGEWREGFIYRGWLLRVYDSAGHLVLEEATTPLITRNADKIAKLQDKKSTTLE